MTWLEVLKGLKIEDPIKYVEIDWKGHLIGHAIINPTTDTPVGFIEASSGVVPPNIFLFNFWDKLFQTNEVTFINGTTFRVDITNRISLAFKIDPQQSMRVWVWYRLCGPNCFVLNSSKFPMINLVCSDQAVEELVDHAVSYWHSHVKERVESYEPTMEILMTDTNNSIVARNLVREVYDRLG